MKRDVAILGAGGFTGRELLRILQRHPCFQVVFAGSDRYAGQLVRERFPEALEEKRLRFQKQDELLPAGAVVLLATPNEFSLQRLPSLIKEGHAVVDLSAAFRLSERAVWEQVYGQRHSAFELVSQMVFGLPELFRSQISKSRLISNPGCYATAAIIPLYALGEYRKELQSVTIHACSGVSGAGGRSEEGGFLFQQIHENFRAYKVLTHQHEAEIAEYAASGLPSRFSNSFSESLVFVPHLLPLYRGILATITLRWKGQAPSDLEQRLANFAREEPFVEWRRSPESVDIQRVQNSNFLTLGLSSRRDVTVIAAALDNLVKGAAGQAIQNLNLMFGIPETEGLL